MKMKSGGTSCTFLRSEKNAILWAASMRELLRSVAVVSGGGVLPDPRLSRFSPDLGLGRGPPSFPITLPLAR